MDEQQHEAGWYDNPEGEGQRYWDGGQWTDQYRQEKNDRPKWWTRKFAIPVWALIVGGLVLFGLGTAGGPADLSDDLATAQSRAADAEAKASEAEERADEAEAAARADLETEYAKREEELAQRAAALDEREEAISQDERVVAMSTFGNGVYEVGVDIMAGKYRADGGGTCYWQKSPVDASDEIIDNGLVDGPTTVVIQDGILFTSQDCGTWTKQD